MAAELARVGAEVAKVAVVVAKVADSGQSGHSGGPKSDDGRSHTKNINV